VIDSRVRLLALPVGFLVLVYVLPIGRLLLTSVWQGGGLTLAPYRTMLASPAFLRTVATTAELAVMVTLITGVLGYLVAFYLAQSSARVRAVGLLITVFPLLTSVLVRTFAWTTILGRTGLVNVLLLRIGIIEEPLALIFNRTGIYIGLVHVLLPLCVLPIYTTMLRIDGNLLRAGESLGASPVRVFATVYLPLTLPGVAAGGLLVFIAAAGSYITPLLLGSERDTMIAGLIGEQIDRSLNWSVGAAMSVVLLMTCLAGFALHGRVEAAGRAARS
jgi:ABC-type spermidine/putrescine transport system permease subunit I